MRRPKAVLVTLGLAVLGLVIQATLFRRLTWVAPDLVLLVVILASLSMRPEAALPCGFVAGAMADVVSNSLFGLRALAYTVVVYLAGRSNQRADAGRVSVAVWAGWLTLASVVIVLLIGLLFGQSTELGTELVRRLIQVPLSNALLAGLLVGPITRVFERSKRRV
jgi:rod shape-determining protein MreD